MSENKLMEAAAKRMEEMSAEIADLRRLSVMGREQFFHAGRRSRESLSSARLRRS
jgi:hypothetical protein